MKSTESPPRPALSIRNLTKALGGREVLHGIDLEFQPGGFSGLAGPNGAGKTVLLKCVTGRLHVEPGCVFVGGIDLALSAAPAKRRIGFAVEPDHLPAHLTGRQYLELVASAKQTDRLPDPGLLDALELPAYLDTVIGAYSTGTAQKVGIAGALIGDPSVVVLDESLNGLDTVSAHVIKTELRQRVTRGASVILTSHVLETLEKTCSDIAHLDRGTAGAPLYSGRAGRTPEARGTRPGDLAHESPQRPVPRPVRLGRSAGCGH